MSNKPRWMQSILEAARDEDTTVLSKRDRKSSDAEEPQQRKSA